jgi:hypothetical protein
MRHLVRGQSTALQAKNVPIHPLQAKIPFDPDKLFFNNLLIIFIIIKEVI